ncbi:MULTISPECIES: mandelate racemase/muconate lactonizing enzyme family protein [unclassified Shinella]|uniref:mandelate racemase/muconate lactonizing enzyme family protein n=1 Tax=unclassified Shinella TaxID=2643062 RepID=UPI00225D2017|nr:mandelate racemase/muconate lactonizing enzyme family protein [Shinella sp. YE25]MDC7259071.1 mandelate racemase/muconate lactonizing enzyme family protein [Shinella sp. YE25]CAI0335850.1 Mandelate racemase [Rhizobiaceae bacterium]CAK7261245.1 Mandelate racemase [Shinella sp. WSC3-e]
MKIKRIETFCNRHVGFVRITDETGATGWGQVSTYNADITSEVLHRQVAPYTVGAEIADLDDHLDRLFEREHKFPGSYLCRAFCGLDTAIWDLRGKLAEKPVAALLGGSAGPLRAYASSMKRDITPADEAERFRRLRGEYGFDAFKFRVGAECGRDRDEWPGRTEEIIPAIARAVGAEADLLADANSCYSPARAIEVGRIMQDNGLVHYEEPCPYWELEQTRQVTEALDIDVTGGEQDCDLATWRRMIEMRAVDIVQPDICYLGGISRTLRVVRMAAAAGLPVTPHAANLSMVTLFTMHLLRAIPNGGKYLEFSIEGEDYYPWQDGLFRSSPYAIVDGRATVGEEPGWGVEIDPEWLARSSYQMSEAN